MEDLSPSLNSAFHIHKFLPPNSILDSLQEFHLRMETESHGGALRAREPILPRQKPLQYRETREPFNWALMSRKNAASGLIQKGSEYSILVNVVGHSAISSS